MPHAALIVVQLNRKPERACRKFVSMPHAALFVVQLQIPTLERLEGVFQCRTQHCLWCNKE